MPQSAQRRWWNTIDNIKIYGVSINCIRSKCPLSNEWLSFLLIWYHHRHDFWCQRKCYLVTWTKHFFSCLKHLSLVLLTWLREPPCRFYSHASSSFSLHKEILFYFKKRIHVPRKKYLAMRKTNLISPHQEYVSLASKNMSAANTV